MPESVVSSLLAVDVWSDAYDERVPCPGCGSDRFPFWNWVLVDGLEVLTHDGDVMCPKDANFGSQVCADCDGLGCVVDEDGSLSGKVGLIVPCVCAEIAETYPVTIGPEDEPMPGYRAQTFTSAPPVLKAVAA
ncbi:hypothetical protein ACIO1C_03820 [Streptomyces sp. NPDC087420]|uniref:hypothetical protein n=1 Tax=Streptomyces sp. NPDC087420 TaxID=3365785 RepID=UPI0038383C59